MRDKRRSFSMQARGRSFVYAFRGLRFAVETQHNLWIDICMALIVVGLALWVGLDPFKWAILAAIIGLVISMEVMNTAIEALVDLVSPKRNSRAALAKDLAAAAVLLSALTSVVIGLLVLGPPLLEKLKVTF